jgi:hypothetical protein
LVNGFPRFCRPGAYWPVLLRGDAGKLMERTDRRSKCDVHVYHSIQYVPDQLVPADHFSDPDVWYKRLVSKIVSNAGSWT